MSQENITDVTLTKAEGLWFDDADTVFQAEFQLFRVSRCILSARSRVFHDILTIPSTEQREVYEDCTLIRLPDSAEDVTLFFKAIFDSSFFEASHNLPKIELIIPIFRMSNKYQVSYLERRAFFHLNRLFYFKGDLHRRKTSNLRQAGILPSQGSTKDEMNRIYKAHLAVIELAHSHGKMWILPRAMVFFCTLPSMDAVLQSDAWIQSPNFVREHILQIREKFIRSRLGFLSAFPTVFNGSHAHDALNQQNATSANCRIYSSHFLLDVLSKPDDLMKYIPGLSTWDSYMWGVCQKCKQRAISFIDKAEVQFWRGLPKVMGIGNWEDLKKELDMFMREAN